MSIMRVHQRKKAWKKKVMMVRVTSLLLILVSNAASASSAQAEEVVGAYISVNGDTDIPKQTVQQNQEAQDEALEETCKSQEEENKCTLYLAPSSIPNAGIGIYTTVPLPKDTIFGDPEVAIPVNDILLEELRGSLLADVAWGADLFQDFYTEAYGYTQIFYPGFGAAVNCHMSLNNIYHSDFKVDSAGLHRYRDAGTGAFTNYQAIGNKATRDIEAGSELFVDYGDYWLTSREATMGPIPSTEAYQVADRILEHMIQIIKDDAGHADARQQSTSHLDQIHIDTWDLIRTIADGRVRAALPPSSLPQILLAGKIGTAQYSLTDNTSVRSTSWLQEHGTCVDHIQPRKSSIPQAGRGAFAKRHLSKNEIIAPVPIMPMSRAAMVTYEPKVSKRGHVEYGEANGHQLILNYCFGHKNSSVLLLPYGPTVGFVNHYRHIPGATHEQAEQQQEQQEGPNAALRWYSKPTLNEPLWLKLPLQESTKKSFGLVMELYALRDIAPGEEILIDYGQEWERAFEAHVAQFQPRAEDEGYVAAWEMREKLKKKEIEILTEEEQIESPYPNGVQTACYYMPTQAASFEEGDEGIPSAVSKEVQRARDLRKTAVRIQYKPEHKDCLRPCRILSRTFLSSDSQTTKKHVYYTAEMGSSPNQHQDCVISKYERHVVHNIPSHSISFLDKLYSKDQYWKGAFRKEMGMPEGVFPEAWMDERD